MKNFSKILIFFIISINLCSCKKDKISPEDEYSQQTIAVIKKNYIDKDYEYDLYIYSPPTNNLNDYIIKTSNKNIKFIDNFLIDIKTNHKFDMHKYKGMRIEYNSRKPNEPEIIKRGDITFDI